MKRKNYISWDEYFMAIALLSCYRSKDPNTRVGVCIINTKKRIVGIGYNGLPDGCSDDDFPWEREGNFLDTKYPYVCHAEPNAILNSTVDDLYKIYTTLFPCNECAKLIIQSGIKEIIYLHDFYHDSKEAVASRKLLDAANVKYSEFKKTSCYSNLFINFD